MSDQRRSDLHIEVAGMGDPTVVLVHAGIADRRMWDREFVALAERHRIVRYDVRGFGRSPDPVRDYFDHEDLLVVLDDAGIDDAVLVGASNGGRIVLDTAVTTPDRVRAIVLVGGAVPGIDMSEQLEADLAREGDALDRGDIERARAINLSWWVDGVDRSPADVDPDVRAAVSRWLDELLPRQAIQARADAGDAQLLEPLMRDRLDDVSVPTLVIVGRHDDEGMRATARHVAARIPDARLVEIDGAAHLPNLERPERFLEELDSFLASLA